jgi:hypothetical protein
MKLKTAIFFLFLELLPAQRKQPLDYRPDCITFLSADRTSNYIRVCGTVITMSRPFTRDEALLFIAQAVQRTNDARLLYDKNWMAYQERQQEHLRQAIENFKGKK